MITRRALRLRYAAAFVALAAFAAACGGGSSSKSGGATTPTAAAASGPATTAGQSPTSSDDTGSDITDASSSASAGGAPAAFTKIELMNDAADNGGITYQDESTVTGIAFESLTKGSVAFAGSGDSLQEGGGIESLSGPTTIASVSYSGFGKGPDKQNAGFLGIQPTGTGTLVALSDFGEEYVSSGDGGTTWTETPLGLRNGPNISQVWLHPDSKGSWHFFDDVGNVWLSPTAPGATAKFTRTWQPEGSAPDPAELPAGACPNSFHQTYYANDQQKAFVVSSDGTTMMYGNGLKDYPAGVCRSTDGGRSFYPVKFPNPPAAGALSVPYVLDFFDDLHGYAARANDLVPGSAWAYTTSDGGATWTAATLPASVNTKENIAGGFHAPDGKTAYLVGFGNSEPLLLKSTDAGATWTDVSAGVVSALADSAGNSIKLHTGYALDADHIWIGGDAGTFLYSATGGQ